MTRENAYWWIGPCIGQKRESAIVPENSVDRQKRETFPVVFHSLSSSFTTQLLKNGRREKGQDSPRVHECVHSLVPPVLLLSPSTVDFLMGGVSAVRIPFSLSFLALTVPRVGRRQDVSCTHRANQAAGAKPG